jgi:Domain of unknown function (DUF4178)
MDQMADMEQTIQNIAQQIPGYLGYQSKERRRDADKVLRERLANMYDTQRDHLTRVIQEATRSSDLNYLANLQSSDQQLQLFITRLRTAPRGYAGWFDAAQIQEADLDQLYQFDSSLTGGVDKLTEALDAVGSALRAKSGISPTLDSLDDTLTELNARLDAREEFVALGKRPSAIPSPLGALQPKAKPTSQATAFEQLKAGDAVSYAGVDYLVSGRIVYSVASGTFFAYLLQDRDSKNWLRVGPGQELAMTREISFNVPSPLPETISLSGKNYARSEQGAASVTVEGASGTKPGSVNYTRYATDGGGRLWIEDWGTETRVQTGQAVDPMEIKLYRKL